MSESKQPRTSTSEWKWRRREAIIRDDYECQAEKCDAKGGPHGDAKLHVHHIVSVANGGSDDSDNLETLCSSCHFSLHGERSEDEGTVVDEDGRKRGAESGQFVTTRSPDDVYGAMDPVEPYTTGELADALGWPQRSVYQALDDLANAGEIRKKKTGPRQAIWIRPEEQS